jgi:hypothetical protein
MRSIQKYIARVEKEGISRYGLISVQIYKDVIHYPVLPNNPQFRQIPFSRLLLELFLSLYTPFRKTEGLVTPKGHLS